MIVLIPAAGVGSRLKPYTNYYNKALLPIEEYQLYHTLLKIIQKILILLLLQVMVVIT